MDYEIFLDFLKNKIQVKKEKEELVSIICKLIENNDLDSLKNYIEKLVPEGDYCYSSEICPFWDINEDYHHQENGYCHFLQGSCKRKPNPLGLGKHYVEFCLLIYTKYVFFNNLRYFDKIS